MHLKIATRSNKRTRSTLYRALLLLLTVFVVSGQVTAQEAAQTQEESAMRLMTEGMQLVLEGSPASLTKAIDKLESARAILHSVKNSLGEATMLSLIGHAYTQLDQNQKASEKFQESLPLFRAAGSPQGEGAALLRLGMIHSALGEMEKAVQSLNDAVRLFQEASDRTNEALALSILGTVHIFLGKTEEALGYYTRAEALYRATGVPDAEASVLNAIAPLYSEAGNPDKARESLERSLSLARTARIPRLEALALLMLGFYHNYQSDLPKARESYEQALPIFRAQYDRFGESAVLLGICITDIASHDYEKGLVNCAQAQAFPHAIGDRQTEAMALMQIALGERGRGNLAASQTAIESAIANIESVRTQVVNPEYRLSFLAGSQDYYEFYIDLLMLIHKQHPKQGYDGKALQASERARVRSLLDTLKEANADIRQGADPALLLRERETQARLNAKAQTQMELLSRAHPETQAKALAEQIETLIRDLQQIETEIRNTSPHYAALMQPLPLTLKEIQTQVLDQSTVLLEYSLGDERSYLYVVTPSSITSYELAKRDEIETAAGDYYKLLSARNTDVKGETDEQRARRVAKVDLQIPLAAASLSRMILAPAASQLGKKRLAIVADGALHFVPFAALPVVSGGATDAPRPLIVDHEIVNLPSASTLSVIRGEVTGRPPARRGVVALADPVFMKDDERVRKSEISNSGTRPRRANQASARGENAVDRQLVKASQETGVATEGMNIPRLPGTRREAEQIVTMVPTADGRLALDFAASRDTATSVELGQYRYVHFSTHGLLNSLHPELSGLVFSLVNERGEAQDGFLRAHEIFNLKIPAELVVLSACQTGIGKEIRGEGLVSLTRGFMHAGAPRVVVSLWDISDRGTPELMVRFYQRMLKEGMQPAAALRAAQVSLMSDKRWASPYYWASFTLQGEWR